MRGSPLRDIWSLRVVAWGGVGGEELSARRRRRRRRRRHLVPIVPICLFPENKSVYVQKIKAYVQKIKAFVSCLHMMEFVIYKEILKSGKPTSGIFW